VRAAVLSLDGRTALTSAGLTARVWDAAADKELCALRHDNEVLAVAISPDRRTALTGGWDKTARLWDAASGKLIAALPHDSQVNAVAFSPDGRTVLTGSGGCFKTKGGGPTLGRRLRQGDRHPPPRR
jgi:WD40 repeat protein